MWLTARPFSSGGTTRCTAAHVSCSPSHAGRSRPLAVRTLRSRRGRGVRRQLQRMQLQPYYAPPRVWGPSAAELLALAPLFTAAASAAAVRTLPAPTPVPAPVQRLQPLSPWVLLGGGKTGYCTGSFRRARARRLASSGDARDRCPCQSCCCRCCHRRCCRSRSNFRQRRAACGIFSILVVEARG